MKKVIIAVHPSDAHHRTYMWECDEHVYDFDIERGVMYAVVDSNKQMAVVKIVGNGYVNEDAQLKKAYKVFEIEDATI